MHNHNTHFTHCECNKMCNKFFYVNLFFFFYLSLFHNVYASQTKDFNLQLKAVNLGNWLVIEGWMKPSLFDGIINNDLLVYYIY